MRPDTERAHRARVARVLRVLQADLDRDLPLDELARVAHLSPHHFHRIFRGLVGETVSEHVRRLRLERAAFRLLRTDRPVTDVAFEAGYGSHEAFTRAFQRHYACSPSGFRDRHRRTCEIAAPSGVHYRGADGPADFASVPRDDVPRPERIVDRSPRRVLTLRHEGPYLESLPTWNRLLAIAPSGERVGICHDDPAVTPPERLRYDACVVTDAPAPAGCAVRELPGGPFARFVHEGPYEELAGRYEAYVGGWLPRSGYEVRDLPCLEVYERSPLDGAAFAAPPRTAVYVPVAGRAG